MILLPLREKMKWQVDDTYLNGRAGPWLRVHAVSGAEDWPAGDIIHLSYDGLGRADGQWASLHLIAHVLCVSSDRCQTWCWLIPSQKMFLRRSSGKSTGEFISCFNTPSRRWQEMERCWMSWNWGRVWKIRLGKKKIVEWRAWKKGRWGALIGRGEQKGEGHFEKKRNRMREEIEKSSSKLLLLDWEHSFLSLAGRGSLAWLIAGQRNSLADHNHLAWSRWGEMEGCVSGWGWVTACIIVLL